MFLIIKSFLLYCPFDILINALLFQGANLIVAVVFWSMNAVLLSFDLTGKPKWILQYKVQQEQDIPVSILFKNESL